MGISCKESWFIRDTPDDFWRCVLIRYHDKKLSDRQERIHKPRRITIGDDVVGYYAPIPGTNPAYIVTKESEIKEVWSHVS